MTRNLKALGLALLVICALGAVAVQGASAVDHEFHAAKEKVVVTGTNSGEGVHKFQVGAAGTVECQKLTSESTQTGTLVSAGTYKTSTVTVTPHYSECVFGGANPVTVNFNHCAYVFYSETTKGNKHPKDEEKEHANVEIECANEGEKIEAHNNLCTVTIKPQLIKHAVRYKNSPGTVEMTAEKIVLDKARTTASQPINGCLTFPANGSAVGTATGNSKTECFEDLGSALTGTAKTTPTGLTEEGESVGCTVSPGA